MMDWNKRITEYRLVSRNPRFLKSRIEAEKNACHIIDNKCGNLEEVDLTALLTQCNLEHIPRNINTINMKQKETKTRFGQCITGSNANSILENISKCNQLIDAIWNANTEQDVMNILG